MFWAIVLLIWVADCTVTSGIRALGGDQFVASDRASGGSAGMLIAQHAAFDQARDFCDGQRRRLLPISNEPTRNHYALRFRCVPPDSPELARPADNPAIDRPI
jgi:hypothetical protein